MAKQDQIPTTQYVPKYQSDATKAQFDTWFTALAGFCNGAQSPKVNGDITSIRIGSLVFMEGKVTLDGVTLVVDIMPVMPRNNGFINTCSSDGTIKGAKYSGGSKSVDFNGFEAGEYLISGCYIANQKEYK